MKTQWRHSFPTAVLCTLVTAAVQLNPCTGVAQNVDEGRLTPIASATEWRVARRDAHQTVIHAVRHTTNTLTGQDRATTNTVVELATGLNRFDPNTRSWQPASPAFQLTQTGAVALDGAHVVSVPADILTYGGVQVRKDDLIFQVHPLCVAYYDPVDGRSFLLAELASARGWLTASNEIVYSNCFSGTSISLRFRNSYAGLESDLLFHEQPPVTPEELGFSDRTRLELFTELVGDTPNPQLSTAPIHRELDPVQRDQLFEPDFVDQTLNFGSLKIMRGKAYLHASPADRISGEKSRDVPVGKQFRQIGSQRVLIEAVEYARVRNQMALLPRPSVQEMTNAMLRTVNGSRESMFAALAPPLQLPVVPDRSPGEAEFQVAAVSANDPAPRSFVLDWQILNNTPPLDDVTFYGTNVYWIRDALLLSGTTKFLGGTIVRYDPGGAALVIQGSVDCDTSEYSPAIFTGRDDDLYGGPLPDSTATPVPFGYGLDYLRIVGPTGVTLKHLKMKYSYNYCVNFLNSGQVNELWHCQFVHSLGLYAENVTLKVRNALFSDFAIAVDGAYFTADIQHMTGHTCWWYFVSELGTFSVWNSLMSNVPLPGGYTPPSHVAWYTSEQSGLFASIGAGAHYLPVDSPHRNAGVTTIDSALKTDLERMTTTAPTQLSGNAASSLFLAPTAIVDTDQPDRGYHYPAVHYAANVTLDNKTALLTNGVVVATYGDYGFWLKGGELVSEGKPDKLNHLIPYLLPQEESYNWGSTPQNIISTFNIYQPNSTVPDPRVTLRFTVVDRHLDNAYQLFAGDPWRVSNLEIRDSRLIGGQFYIIGISSVPKVGMTNNVFEHVFLDVEGDPDIYCFNNLFLSSQLDFIKFESGQPEGGNWIVKDNTFDRCVLTDFYDPWSSGRSHNAYVSCTRNDWPITAGIDQELADLTYELGQFGKYYLPATASQLINKGSRTPPQAGLYHYTTSVVSGSKDGTQVETPYMVDIGVHWVGVGASDPTQPADADGCSIPDYMEDRNGNGLFEPELTGPIGESDWQVQYSAIANFAGIKQQGESEALAPDTIGAAGPNHFMMVLNSKDVTDKSVVVFDKNTGIRVSPSTTLREFFFLTVPQDYPDQKYRGDHPPTEFHKVFDPQILYDHYSKKWIACAIEERFGAVENVLLAISKDSDPIRPNDGNAWVTNNWDKYLIPFRASGESCTVDIDRDSLGVDANGIYISVSSVQDGIECGTAEYVRIVALHKTLTIAATSKVLPGYLTIFTGLGSAPTVSPALNFEAIPATDRAWFVTRLNEPTIKYNALRWLEGAANPPAWDFLPTLPWGSLSITAPFKEQYRDNLADFPPQLGRPNQVELDSRLLMAMTRTLGGVRYLWTCHNIGVNRFGSATESDPADRSAIAWYKIRLDGAIAIADCGRAYDTAASIPMHYFYPSLAVNGRGEMLLGFSGSSINDYIGAYYLWRTSADVGTCGQPQLAAGMPIQYFNGQSLFGDGSDFRWGDYSYTTLDSDDIRIWTVQQYADEGGWGTRVLGVTP